MTFVIGFRCCDGVVLCADSLEGDGYTKRYVNKIETYTVADEWGAGIACSGSGDVIRKFWQKLKGILGNEKYDRDKLEAKVEKTIEILNYAMAPVPTLRFYWLCGPRTTLMLSSTEHILVDTAFLHRETMPA